LPPPKYRDNAACRHHDDPEADLYPVADRGGISLNKPLRPAYEEAVDEAAVEVRDFSLGEAMPQFAAGIDAQIDCDNASDDFIKEKAHSNNPFANLCAFPSLRGDCLLLESFAAMRRFKACHNSKMSAFPALSGKNERIKHMPHLRRADIKQTAE
jgi:hypothetical protein